MKTTMQISDSIFEEARQLAVREHTTMKALVEEGLRKIISERKRKGPFRLRKAAFKGRGLQPRFAGASWEQVRDASYEGGGS
jgi:hypothetical protein